LCNPQIAIAPRALRGVFFRPAAAGADVLEVFDRAGQARVVRVLEVQLIPADAIAVHAAGQREAEMADREPLHERRRPDMEFGDDVIVVLALGVHLPDAANYRTVERTDLSPEQ